MINESELKRNKYEMLKCIWMTSGVIDYKLCDNNFDCENCPFDRIIKNLSNNKERKFNGIVNDTNTILKKLQSIKYDENIIYLKNNLIAKEICVNTFYLGINPILVNLLDNVNLMTIEECRKNISAGEQIMQIEGNWGSIRVSSPINCLIYNKIDNPTDNPLKTEWFAIMGAVHKDVVSSRLHRKEWNKMHSKAIGAIAEIKTEAPRVGETMMDGGSQIKFLHQLIGNKRYIDILNSLSA